MDKETLQQHMQDAQKDIFETLGVELNSWKDVYRGKQRWSSFSSIGNKEIELCVYYISRCKQLYRRIKFDKDCTEEIRPIIGEENIVRSFSSIDVKTATGEHFSDLKNRDCWIKFLGEQLNNLSGEQSFKVNKYLLDQI